MAKRSETGGSFDLVILLFLFALLLLGSPPVVAIWAADDAPWYLPYVLWGVLIVLAARLQRRFSDDF